MHVTEAVSSKHGGVRCDYEFGAEARSARSRRRRALDEVSALIWTSV